MMMKYKQSWRMVSLLYFTLTISGCSHYWDDMGFRNETLYPPSYPIDNPPPPKHGGAIFQSGHEISLYNDRIASRIGDILTVRLDIVTQAQKKTKTKTNKTVTNTFPTPTILGHDVGALELNTATDQEFDGEGEADQQNKLSGTVSVTVMRVLSNGNLVVQGESWVTINQGREYVRLTGIVRPEDIEASNVISSQRVADARISYSGNGQVADVSRGGIGTQFLNKFFPY